MIKSLTALLFMGALGVSGVAEASAHSTAVHNAPQSTIEHSEGKSVQANQSVAQVNIESIEGSKSTEEYSSPATIVDHAQVLSPTEYDQVRSVINNIYRDHGAIVAVEIIDTTRGQAIKDYAHNRHDTLSSQEPEMRDGLLLVVAVDDQEYYASMGSNVMNITEGELKNILSSALPESFREGQYAQGVMDAMTMYAQGDVPENSGSEVKWWYMLLMFIPFIILNPFTFILGFIAIFVIMWRLTRKHAARSSTYIPTEKEKVKIVQRAQEIYNGMQQENASRSFETADGRLGREQALKDRGVLKKKDEYTEYIDRLIIREYFDIITYNTEDSLEFMTIRQNDYDDDRNNETLTAERIYTVMSYEDKILFDQRRNRTTILEKFAYGFDTDEKVQKSLDLEEELALLLQHDTDIEHYKARSYSSNSTNHRSGFRSSSRSSSRSRSSGGRGAGGSW